MHAADDLHDQESTGRQSPPNSRNTGEVRALAGSDLVSNALDELWAHVDTQDGQKGGDGVVTRMQNVNAAAHIAGLRPEELLTLLKSSWRARPPVRNRHTNESDDEQLSRLVTMCIKGYFAERKAGS